jgi:hypothetical protein
MDNQSLGRELGTAWVIVGLAALLAGCIPFIFIRTGVTVVPLAPKACTLAGCIDTLRVNVQGELPQLFQVTLTGTDGSELASDCDLARLAESQDACSDPDVEYYGDYLLFHVAPSQVVLRLDGSGVRLVREMTPAYAWFAPNGPDCEPKCRQGQVEVTIP